ncbi:asparagine--tRNA ligase [Mesoplasma lactucae]|uniref:Asparagine--tRNA ligase n=1 Tax=Mesoplasma lactucae ATCC 49193 TaxID=81460 RepID=A0A291IS45_9MOLU|nr:asparagine--tRNA ligase [Mesoplasma lactucae]ATG97619.1 asparagine--tRNA ligase [Mesoplasma lactucae ATCC 49193]ATZ19920.1 asparaginyl-tRNA synthetase [Mesoplasma lactucae ATCC 49193]MCL8216784.1 Asparagine--tRNA ligase [Mesoplasma lactucae ATCC 49193]
MDIRELYIKPQEGDKVTFLGRVRSNRAGKKVSFLVVNDGTTMNDAQIVYKDDLKNYEEASKIRVGSIVEIQGTIHLTPDRPQPFEIQATSIECLDEAIEAYPLQKKEHSLEYLREIAQLRARTKTFNAVFKIRSIAAFAIHKFFQSQNFVYVNTPIITSNDAEGAGEEFGVITYDSKNNPLTTDFFNKKASLTVSGQLNAEAFAQAFKKVYTFGPTFRAEQSFTSRHASEFWMIEPEVAFNTLEDNIELIEAMLKYIFKDVLENAKEELEFLDENVEKGLVQKLEKLSTEKYVVNTYEQVIEMLKKAVDNKEVNFENNDIHFGLDLGTEHERYLCEVINKAPTFVTNYPKDIKAFYMKLNPDEKTVAAVDLLVPGIGELVGGSEREGSFDKLMKRCEQMGIDPTELDWYIQLRQYGYYKSAGFGLGFERLIMYITGMTNIRDVIPYPRTPKNLLF